MKSGWFSSLLIVLVCVAIAWHPIGASTLFGLVDTGELFTSDDEGVTWTVRSTLPISDANAIAAGESPSELFMATRSGLVYQSTDGGVNWTAVGAVSASDLVDMAIRTNGDVLLLSEKGTLWLSTDDGVTFTSIATLTASNHVSLTGDAGGGNLYALTQTGEVARSTDVGSTWNVVGAVTTSDAVAIRAVGLTLYVLTGAGDVARSTDQGTSWIMIGTISQVHMAGLTRNGTDLVAATEEGLIATSGDAVSWSFAGSINQLTVVAIGNDTPNVTGIGGHVPSLSPLRMRVLWPNPAPGNVDAITVLFELDSPDQVALRVYDVTGKSVGEAAPRAFGQAGEHTIRWIVGGLPSGVYFVQLVAKSGLTAQAKLAIVR